MTISLWTEIKRHTIAK